MKSTEIETQQALANTGGGNKDYTMLYDIQNTL